MKNNTCILKLENKSWNKIYNKNNKNVYNYNKSNTKLIEIGWEQQRKNLEKNNKSY